MILEPLSNAALAATFLMIQMSVFASGRTWSRPHPRHKCYARQAAGSVAVPINELQTLESYIATLSLWVNSTSTSDPKGVIAQLQQDVQTFQGWISSWIDIVIPLGAPNSAPTAPNVLAPPSSAKPRPSIPAGSDNNYTPAGTQRRTPSFQLPLQKPPNIPALSNTTAPSGRNSTFIAYRVPFDYSSKSNVAVYYSQAAVTSQGDLG